MDRAVERGVERDCDAIQIFNQSPRMWRPTAYTEDDFAEFREAMGASRIKAVLIHAVYLHQLRHDRSRDPQEVARVADPVAASRRRRSARSAWCCTPAPRRPATSRKAIKRAGEVIKEALAETETCELHLEDTAGAGGTLGRSFEELAELIDAAGGGQRLGICLDSCHLFASGYDIRTPRSLGETVDQFDRVVGLKRLGSLHVNDSMIALGSNRDRHAIMGEGDSRREGLRGVPVRAAVRQAAVRAGDRPRSRSARARGRRSSRRSCATRGKSNRRRA